VLGADLAGRDVFGLIEEATGQPLGAADVTVAPAVADPNTAALLGVAAGAPLFAIERLSRLADGRPVDLEYLRVRGDRMTLSATLHR
jgi:GntR family transcriptional regulator